VTGPIALLAALLAAAVLGALWRSREGRLRPTTVSGYDWTTLGVDLGDRATLVQFSSAFCAPCRTTRAVLARVGERVEGVVHVDVDAESHLAAVRELGIVSTPTTLVLDRAGRELARATGVPRLEDVVAMLGRPMTDKADRNSR
jgi:thiol-disulfide isomerase/thioredoxin